VPTQERCGLGVRGDAPLAPIRALQAGRRRFDRVTAHSNHAGPYRLAASLQRQSSCVETQADDPGDEEAQPREDRDPAKEDHSEEIVGRRG
jgi:hypothetical protein